MAFGSGNNSNKPNPHTQSSHHHHHHHHQSSSSTSATANASTNQTGGGGGIPLPPKGYYAGDASSSSSSFHHHHHNRFFPGGGGGGGSSASGSSLKSKQSQQSYFPGSSGGTANSGGFSDGGHNMDGVTGSAWSQQQYNQFFHQQQQPQHNRDLTPSERLILEQIRARKAELLKEIAQLQDEIDSVSRELLFSQTSQQPQSTGAPPPPDLINTQQQQQQHQEPPLADVELDNLSEHSNNNEDHKVPNVLGSNSSSNTTSSSSKEKDRLKLMSLGCKKFNMDPKKGIEFLVENGLLKKQEQDIALFLYRGEGLNKTAIGDYLGEKSDFNERVLKSFVGLHDFTDLILVQALRQFLWSFRLPGEAQKIDRMMECFAQRYCQNNPDIFTNTDTCYVLSFAIIMLNTSLHNPSVKDKPTVDTFISMNRGINNGGDLPRELLISLYNSIQSEPFKIPEDDGNDLMHTFFNPDKEGWLWKQGGRYKTWKRRWFILNDNCLYYFEFTTDKEPRGIIPLENVGVREIEDGGSSKSRQRYCFELYATDGSEVIKACKTDSDGRVVEGKHSVYRMSAASSEERDSWVKALRQSISYSPFYEILRKSGGGGGNSSSSLRSGRFDK